MGPENNGGPMVAYIDGKPVEIGQDLPEITPDYSAGGVSAEDVAEAMATVSKAWADVSITMEVAAEGLRAFMYSLELGMAVHLARIFEPDLCTGAGYLRNAGLTGMRREYMRKPAI